MSFTIADGDIAAGPPNVLEKAGTLFAQTAVGRTASAIKGVAFMSKRLLTVVSKVEAPVTFVDQPASRGGPVLTCRVPNLARLPWPNRHPNDAQRRRVVVGLRFEPYQNSLVHGVMRVVPRSDPSRSVVCGPAVVSGGPAGTASYLIIQAVDSGGDERPRISLESTNLSPWKEAWKENLVKSKEKEI